MNAPHQHRAGPGSGTAVELSGAGREDSQASASLPGLVLWRKDSVRTSAVPAFPGLARAGHERRRGRTAGMRFHRYFKCLDESWPGLYPTLRQPNRTSDSDKGPGQRDSFSAAAGAHSCVSAEHGDCTRRFSQCKVQALNTFQAANGKGQLSPFPRAAESSSGRGGQWLHTERGRLSCLFSRTQKKR